MEYRAIERGADAFQRPVPPDVLAAMCARAFGADVAMRSAIEVGGGLYNTTYRVETADGTRAILRVAPEPARQARIERVLMRNEQAALPFFAPVAAMMPRTLFADWTHELLGRDYVMQTVLDGVPAGDGLRAYPRAVWAGFYRQLGALTRAVHSVAGTRFGPVAGPTFATWSDAVLSSLEDTAADLEDAGLDAADVWRVTDLAAARRATLDEITEPRLLHGDLWVPNVMLAPAAPEPTITGLLDHDRASWGDPAADWGIHIALQRADRAPFWDTYGTLRDTAAVRWRALVYRARHIGAVRLERHRIGRADRIPASYADLSAVLDALA